MRAPTRAASVEATQRPTELMNHSVCMSKSLEGLNGVLVMSRGGLPHRCIHGYKKTTAEAAREECRRLEKSHNIREKGLSRRPTILSR